MVTGWFVRYEFNLVLTISASRAVLSFARPLSPGECDALAKGEKDPAFDF